MGSGHFADEGSSKASYFRDMQVVNSDNKLIPLSNLNVFAEEPKCYNIIKGTSNEGNYFYYGGPGKNMNCP
ncbi:carboxyl-terminal peptidase [Medicago truncatula]|uniref:Carboxyl-terminal peptidase n=2 Tax=Medicago truncatula TaxID=3880 RepID=A0A072V9P1_MEDTR|nr:carboxyl-terminal peptidase [Medicago truncatula]